MYQSSWRMVWNRFVWTRPLDAPQRDELHASSYLVVTDIKKRWSQVNCVSRLKARDNPRKHQHEKGKVNWRVTQSGSDETGWCVDITRIYPANWNVSEAVCGPCDDLHITVLNTSKPAKLIRAASTAITAANCYNNLKMRWEFWT